MKPIFVRPLTAEEQTRLTQGLRSSDAFTLRRCQIVLASDRGEHASVIGARLGYSDQGVRKVIKDFNARGLDALGKRPLGPKTRRYAFDAQGAERLKDLLHQSPRDFGKETSVWTLNLLAEVSHEEGLTTGPVTGETVRMTLKRLKVRWLRAKQWVASPDPKYGVKKGGVTG
jgi:transposase